MTEPVMLEIGDQAPDFTLPANGEQTVSLSDYKGQYLVLYFYPKDDTSGCTKEACAFNDLLPQFKDLNTSILGVSKDPVKKHDKFVAKYGLTFPLISDEESDLCERYGVWKEKSMYGKTYMGIERSTFIIDPEGKISEIWRKVKVNGHVETVKEALESRFDQAA